MKITRFTENPFIKPSDIKPSRTAFEVVCAINAGVARLHEETILLLRVAERPLSDALTVRVPILDCSSGTPSIEIREFTRSHAGNRFHDPQKVFPSDRTFLTTLSHLRVARSRDGRHFTVDDTPALLPDRHEESLGLEDPRITEIDGQFYVAYKSVSEIGIIVSLAVTAGFSTFSQARSDLRSGKYGCLYLPGKNRGKYLALNRPVSRISLR